MDVVWLARLQFSLTIMFHFLFPPISIGLAFLVLALETARWRTGKDVYRRASDFWLDIFALTFVVGVATGIVMEFQFGTNWAAYSRFVGDIFGAPAGGRGGLRLLPRVVLHRPAASSGASASPPSCAGSPP